MKTMSNMENKNWREELQEIIEEEETDMGGPMIPRHAKCYAKLVLEDFISSEIEKDRKKLVSDINNTLKESIENNESVNKVIEKIDIKVFDVDESSTIRIDMVNMVNSELSKAREEVLIELQKEFSEFGVPDDVRYTQPLFYINEVIEKKLSELKDNK